MPVASMARPINPPSASISRTRCPLAVPPTAGLQGMCATVSRDRVHSPTRHPIRAAAYAASTPAWPAPTTITSNCIPPIVCYSLSDAEPLENLPQHIVRSPRADDLVEVGPCRLQIDEQKLLGGRLDRGKTGALDKCAGISKERDVAEVGNCGGVAQRFVAGQYCVDPQAQIRDAVAARCGNGQRAWGIERDAPIGLVQDDDPRNITGSLQEFVVVLRQRTAPIQHHDDEVRHLTSPRSASDAFAFDDIERISNAGRIHESERQSFDFKRLRYQVPRSARHIRDDRSIGS